MAIDYTKPIDIRDGRNGGWFWVDKEVWSDKRLTQSDKVIYGTLAYFANNKNQSSFPSISTIEEYSNASNRQVYLSIKKLERYKYVSIIRKRGKPNEYTLIDEAILERKRGGAKFAGVQNNTTTPANKHNVPLQNNTTNKTVFKQELHNNNDVNNSYKKDIDKMVNWAYNRAAIKPSCNKDQFIKAVEVAISKHGYSFVYDRFAKEENAIKFLTEIKNA